MSKSKEITINDQTVEITKIPIGKFADLMMSLEKLPSVVMDLFDAEELDHLDAQTLIPKLPTVLSKSQDELFKLIATASDMNVKDIKVLDFEEFLDLIIAVLELNNIQAIVQKVKNLGNILKAKAK